MNGKVKINVGDYIFKKDDVADGESTILYRVDEATERDLKRYNDKTGYWEVYARETLVGAYCWESGRNYTISIRHDRNEWAVLPADTMKALCA